MMKESILKQNKDDYSNIRNLRATCLEERYRIKNSYTEEKQEMFMRQKSQEHRLQSMYQKNKMDRLNQNK